MCGIVGLIGDTSSIAARNMFKMMLFFDTIRGKDSTGVIRVESNGEVSTVKDAVTAERFLEYRTVDNFLSPRNDAAALIGHNRAATVGGVNPNNAHPFTYGDITMVHNGTLRNEHVLTKYREFDVDSEMFTAEIDIQGLEKTISEVKGAYAIVYHDKRDNTVNILRNSERPLHMAVVRPTTSTNAKTAKATIAIASEAWMIAVAANKCKMEIEGDIKSVPTMVHHCIDLEELDDQKAETALDIIKKEELEAPSEISSRYLGYASYGRTNTTSTTKKEKDETNVTNPVKRSTDRAYRFRPEVCYQDVHTGLYYVDGITDGGTDIRCIVDYETFKSADNSEIQTISAGFMADIYTTPAFVGVQRATKKTVLCSQHLGGFFLQKKLKALPEPTKTT